MIKQLFILLFAFGMSSQAMAQRDTIAIKTSAVCDMCKEAIENKLNYTKGIRFADLTVETKMVAVIYNSKKTNPDKIRKTINGIGYTADDQPADPKAFEALPACCKSSEACTEQ